MSGNASTEAATTTTAAAISEEYLADLRLRVRLTATTLDGEVKDLISAARADLALGGVLPARAADESDPLVKQAIATYLKAEFGLDNEDAEKYRASYQKQKVALSLSTDYISSGEEV